MKRILPLLLVMALAVGLLAGCQEELTEYTPTGNGLSDSTGPAPTYPGAPEEPKILTLAYYPDRSMNPYESMDFTNRALFSLMYQGLFSVDRNYQAQPVLCKTYQVSDDMQSYTFYLDEASFSDGTRVTAEDVAASLEAAKKSSFYGGRFTHIKSVSVTDDGGVQVNLNTPYEDLPILLDIPVVKSSETGAAIPMGSGPYVLETEGSGTRLRRQSSWWCNAATAVSAPVISLMKGESPKQIRDDFDFSDLSLVCADPGADNYVDYPGDQEIWESETGMFVYLGCRKDSKVFSNEAVRTALTHAIDRDALAAKFYHGFAHSATLPASPLSPYYNETLAERYGYNPQKFTDALAGAQIADPTVTLLLNKDDIRRLRVGREIAKMLEAAGLKVERKELNAERYQKALRSTDYDLYLGQTKLSANMDLSPFFQKGGSLSFGGMSDSALYSMCLEALANRGNYQTLHEMVMTDGRICPILFRSYAVYAKRGTATNLNPSRDNVFYYGVEKTAEPSET